MPDVMKTVGRYEILRELGRGGMALVYLARQTDLDRFVALKELGAFHASDASFAQRFLRESRVAGSLSHPNIVTVHDYFEHEGTPYIAMEYVERGSLRPYVGKMTMAQIGGVLEGLLAGLTNAEQNGIVHRDLKPENLMVTSDGRVKIADFGIAKATTKMQTGAFLTATGTTVGTPTYMAPEQAMAQEIGPWTDLYSVGCMAFEMFTGRVPFHDSDAPMAILLRHVNEPIPAVKSVDDSVDQGLSDWVEALLVKDPKERTQSANEAWDDFEELIIGLLGPRWRREARLFARAEQVDTPKPLTPAPFEGAPAEPAPSEEFQSFAWGEPVSDTPPGPVTPPPADAPSGPLEPGPIDVPTGPPTPPPMTPVDDGGFVTFGAPADAPPEDAAPPAPADAAPPAPADAAPPAPAEAAPPAPSARPTSASPSRTGR
jgi:serine/threonine protein kinase